MKARTGICFGWTTYCDADTVVYSMYIQYGEEFNKLDYCISTCPLLIELKGSSDIKLHDFYDETVASITVRMPVSQLCQEMYSS
jgi:hypothetical protein